VTYPAIFLKPHLYRRYKHRAALSVFYEQKRYYQTWKF